MILVDTSVWIAVLRRRRPVDLEAIVEFEEVVTCPPVVQEVLQGIRDDAAHRVVRESLLALPVVEAPVAMARHLEAAALYRAARKRGLTVRSGADCLVAACALAHDLEVLHADRDYEVLAGVSALRSRRVG